MRSRRIAEATAFVAVWMALAWVLPLDTNGVLVLGVPLTAAFQRLVRRQPLRALWVRAGPPLVPSPGLLALAALFAIVPCIQLVGFVQAREASGIAWEICALIGAVAAAYSFLQIGRAGLADFLRCVAIGAVIGCGTQLAMAWLKALAAGVPLTFHPLVMAMSFASYVPAMFLLEEVTFRGLVDAHIHAPGDDRPWSSATYVSVLWSVWHLPLFHPSGAQLPAMAVMFCLMMVPLGVPLSMFWRRSGNLAGPAVVHALVDALRNGLR